MQEYKTRFIDFLLKTGALKVGGDFTLKSKRSSPWFVNLGEFNDGESSAELGQFYADLILDSGTNFDLVYGIPEKGNALAVATAIGLNEKGKNKPWFFTRKNAKEYGEGTTKSSLVVGRAPKDGQSIIQLDDVFTAGNAKYEARAILQKLGNFNFPLLAIAVDRQEVGIDGKSAIEEYEQKTGTKVVSVVNALEIYNYLKENAPVGEIKSKDVERMGAYLRVYGTKTAREAFGKLEQKIIEQDNSIIIACDVGTLSRFEELVKQTSEVAGIGGYKIGFELGLGYGLPAVVAAARKHTPKPLIYDHQKAGTDIPDTGKNFARVCKKAGIDTVILFPQAGPETERAWIYHALDQGLKVIVGGKMTHPAYTVSEGGFITDEGALEIYKIAGRAGVSHFVVPGNKPEVIKTVRETIEAEGIIPVFYAPGFVAQGGKIADFAVERWHAIIGRGIYQAEDMRKAAIEFTNSLAPKTL